MYLPLDGQLIPVLMKQIRRLLEPIIVKVETNWGTLQNYVLPIGGQLPIFSGELLVQYASVNFPKGEIL